MLLDDRPGRAGTTPGGARPRPATAPDDEVVRTARATTRRHARTFSLACLLLPRRVRDDVRLLYLVLRTLDDLVDEGDPAAPERLRAVEAWAARDPATPDTAETRILDVLAARHDLPRSVVADFCAGMRDDLEWTPPATEEDLDLYCYRVAGTVGLLMASILGVRGDPEAARRDAVALGIAMQRTNILRDIDEDAAVGRRYIAGTAVAAHGPPDPGARADLLREQIARADALYAQGIAGTARLRHGRWAIRAAGAMYREILREIEREGLGRRAGRAVVPAGRRLRVGARALVTRV